MRRSLRTIHLLALPLAALAFWTLARPVTQHDAAFAQSAPATDRSRPDRQPPNVLRIDDDNDTRGVGCSCCDADDTNASVGTCEQAMAASGDVRALLARRGYNPAVIHFISNTGDDKTAADNDPAKPYASLETVWRKLRPGSCVIFREGTWSDKYVLVCDKLRGSRDKPIIFMAMPGEKVIIEGAVSAIEVRYSSDLIFDGLTLKGTGGSGQGVNMHNAQRITFRNIESSHHSRGFFAMQDLHSVTIERCVIHDNGSHGIYLGSRDLPNSDIVVRDCLLYRNGRHGLQHNGRVTNLLVENNVIHSNSYGGVSFLQGVCNSIIRGNYIFNNNRQGVIFYCYDDAPNSGILAFDQNDNLIQKNVIWVGKSSWEGSTLEPREHAAVQFHDNTSAQKSKMDRNTIRDNVLVSCGGPVLLFNQKRLADSAVVSRNIMYRTMGPKPLMTCENSSFSIDELAGFNANFAGNRFADPLFRDVSVTYNTSPEKFDFTRQAEH